MGEHYVFSFKGSEIDAAGMLNQMPYVVVGGGNSEGGYEEFEVRAAKRSAAIAVGQVLIAEDISFEMRKE